MNRRILGYEIKKLVCSPALLAFLALCLAFNILIMPRYFEYADYVAEASKTTGYRLGTDFEGRIPHLEPGRLRDYFEVDTSDVHDVFDGYDTAYIAEAYIRRLGLSGYAANAMRDKYARLQASVDEKAATGESLTLYFASATYSKHGDLYGTVMLVLLLQGALIAALIMLLSLGYENHNQTAQIVYASKTGRKILYHKQGAALLTGLATFIVLTAATLAVYFAFNDYGNIWGSSISSGYNYVRDILAGNRPFTTWRSFTIFTYLLASLGISALLTICFGLMAFVIGAWLKNSYIGFIFFLICNAACLVVPVLFPARLFTYTIMLSPVWLWLKNAVWFTDGGADILWRHYETLGAFASLILLAGLSVFSAVMFKRRDIA